MRMGLMVVVLAVVAATLLRNDGVVSVFVAGWRADIALNLALLGLVVAWLVAWWLARLWRSVRLTPQRMRAWRLQQRERACYAAVLDAMALVLAQRHKRGQRAAHQALQQLAELNAADGHKLPRLDSLWVMAHWAEAEAERGLRHPEQAEQALAAALGRRADDDGQVAQEALRLRAVRWAMQDGNALVAGQRLEQLPADTRRRAPALRLQAELAQSNRQPLQALAAMRQLVKVQGYTPQAVRSLRRAMAVQACKGLIDETQWRAVWRQLDSDERAMPGVYLAWAVGGLPWLAASEDEAAKQSLAESMWPALTHALKAWDDITPAQKAQAHRMLLPLAPWMPRTWVGQVEALQQAHPQDAWAQLVAGQSFALQGLWGKALPLLKRVAQVMTDATAVRAARVALAQHADEQGDLDAARDAWRAAAR